MADADLRQFVMDALAPLLPKKWKFVPVPRNLDTIDVPTLVLSLQSISRTASAPLGSRDVEYTLTIIEPKTDPLVAHMALDDLIVDLLGAIDDLPDLVWRTATAVTYGDTATNFAFDITLTTQYTKETT